MTGTPSVRLVHPTDNNTVVSKEEHQQHRTGVDMLLYLIRYTRPEIANEGRELNILNEGPTGKATEEMKRIIKYVIDTVNKGLKMTTQKK